MKSRLTTLVAVFTVLIVSTLTLFAQTTGSIGGTVTDANGAVVAGANVTITAPNGTDITVTTSDIGVYRVPALGIGLYTVTVVAPNFKKVVISNVKVDIGLPTTANAKLEVGGVDETITVTSGGEVLQTQTATVGTTITGRQITETPIASRDALDLVSMLPGTATVGRLRTGSINGLPKGSLAISIDGVDVQTNDTRSSDGFFTYVRPRVDAIEEVTVSTAAPGSESSGDGAVQIKFVTKRGNNDYRGGAFFQHRNEALNANYWYLNRNPPVSNSNPTGLDENGRALRQKIRLFQYGVNYSGPIPFPNFGEGGPRMDSGKDRAFFFVNYEEFRLPETASRTRKVATPDLQNGIYKYRVANTGFTTLPTGATGPVRCVPFGATQVECAVNVYQVAAGAPGGQTTTPDPTILGLLNSIRSAVGTGTLREIANNPNVLDYNFAPASTNLRKFLTVRTDVNITKKHSAEFVLNRQSFDGTPDLLNGYEMSFPGVFKDYSQRSNRNSWTVAFRSTLTNNLINEARYAVQEGGPSTFRGEASAADFDPMRGFAISIGNTFSGTALTNPQIFNSNQIGKNPVFDFTDSVTWTMGDHVINFGGQIKKIVSEGGTTSRFVGSVGFGLVTADTNAFDMFVSCSAATFPTTPACNLPGATGTELGEIRAWYATLVGRVTTYTDTAYLNTETNIYEQGIPRIRRADQKSYGLFIQDNWKIRPNFSINYGVRWQPQTGFVARTIGNYTRLESYDQVYGVSGLGNIFKPGATGGTAPRVVDIKPGESAYPTDWNNFAPTVGVVWSPNFGDKGFMSFLFGKSGQSVFRGGYSASFVREGTSLLESINGANPGGTRSLSRSQTIAGSLTLGTNFRDINNPNLRPFQPTQILGTSPTFPIALTSADVTNAFNPNIKTGRVDSYTFGYQRELDRNTVIEVRYVGNRGVDLQRQYNLNEFNALENGFANEFALAQDNLYKNIAAGRGATFAYFGGNTNPLPIMLSYLCTPTQALPCDPTLTARYTGSTWSNTTLVTGLSRNAPNIGAFNSASFEAVGGNRNNALANGRPANFFFVNPTTPNGSWTVDNTSLTWYNSAVVELRRRLSSGLRVSANYVFSKAQANAFTADASGGGSLPPTLHEGGFELAKNVQISDIRHQFKMDATYDLPFGKGRQFFSNSNGFVNAFVGGWSFLPTLRWQSGAPISLGHVQLVGMTRDELQRAVKVRKESSLVFWLPDDIILNTQKAFNVSVANTNSNGGYGTTFGTGGPQGRFIAPAGYGNCIEAYTGGCGFANLIIYGPSFFKLDASLSKRFNIGEKRYFEFRVLALDLLNHPNFRVGGWAGDTATATDRGALFGQLANGSAYQDTSTTNDPGGRIIDFMLRVVW